MATDLKSDFDDFERFLGKMLDLGESPRSLERALEEFRAYQRDLRRFKEETRQSLEESDRGESSPLDIGDVLRRGKNRLERKGIAE